MKKMNVVLWIVAGSFLGVAFPAWCSLPSHPSDSGPRSKYQIYAEYPEACKKNDEAGKCDCSIYQGNCKICLERGLCGW